MSGGGLISYIDLKMKALKRLQILINHTLVSKIMKSKEQE